MVRELRTFPLLDGYRGAPKVDVARAGGHPRAAVADRGRPRGGARARLRPRARLPRGRARARRPRARPAPPPPRARSRRWTAEAAGDLARGIYLTGCEPATGKSAVALGLHQLLSRRIERLGVFRPVVGAAARTTRCCSALRAVGTGAARRRGLGRRRLRGRARRRARARSRRSSPASTRSARSATACWWWARTSPAWARPASSPSTAAWRSTSACRCCASSPATRRTAAEVRSAVSVALTSMRGVGCSVAGVVANRVAPAERRRRRRPGRRCRAAAARAPRGRAADGADGRRDRGRLPRRGRRRREPEALGREALSVLVAAMTLPNLLERITDSALLIAPGDRADVLLTAYFAQASRQIPSVAGLVLTGGLRPPAGAAGAARRAAADHPHRARHLRDGDARGHRRGEDQRARAAQDHRGARAVRAARRRRGAARPARGRRARRR